MNNIEVELGEMNKIVKNFTRIHHTLYIDDITYLRNESFGDKHEIEW